MGATMNAASSAPANGADRRDATRRQMGAGWSTPTYSACGPENGVLKAPLELFENARQRVAEVALDEGRGRVAVAPLQRLDDLLVLVHRAADEVLGRHVVVLVAQ